jgi:hypothetical protein
MKTSNDKDKEIYLSTFHDILIWELGRLEDSSGDPAMWDYQISILEKEDPIKFAKKIKELKDIRESVIKKWKRNSKRIEVMEEELAVYRKYLGKYRKD